MYTGVAIRMTQALRLGREYHSNFSIIEQEIRRRTLWTCFIMDRLVASACSRPWTLRPIKLSIRLPSSRSDFLHGIPPQGPIQTLESGPDMHSAEVIPYYIKAVEYWGSMSDIFATGVRGPPRTAPTDTNGEFFKTEKEIKAWRSSLPSFMKWNLKNYQAHREAGQGNLFVSFHFILHHALCLAHQEYLPEFEGDTAWDETSSNGRSYDRSVVKTCLENAGEITRIAISLHHGDDSDREMLRAPLVGLALESAACCHLWRIHQTNFNEQSKLQAKQELQSIHAILKSWEDVWPIASAWCETIDLLSRLYEASSIQATPFVEHIEGEENQQPTSDEISIGSGYPHPQTINSYRFFDNIRLILMTAADPSSLRHKQTRLHIETWLSRLRMFQAAMEADRASGMVQGDLSMLYDNISSFDAENYMDEFQGLG
jgi:hypothetical protein